MNRAELTQQELGGIADVKKSLQKCVADCKWRDVLAVLRDSAKVNKLLPAAVLREVEHGGEVTSVAFDAKGTRIATGCGDKKVRALSYCDRGAELGIALTACVAWLVDHADSARGLDTYMRAFSNLGAAVLPALFGGGSLLHCMVAFNRPEWLPCLVESSCDLLFIQPPQPTPFWRT